MYFCGVGVITTETSPRRWISSADRDAGCCIFMEFVVYIIPKTTGVGFSKRWVPLHKTMRIFFEGFHTPLFCVWTVLSFRAFVCFALSFVSVPRFRFGCSDSFFCFLLFSWFCLVVVALCVLLHTRKVLAGLSHVGWKQCRHRQDTKTFFGTLIFAENQQNRPTIRP